MWKDFKDFAMRGNVMDLAIAVVIGAAFGKIVNTNKNKGNKQGGALLNGTYCWC